MLYRITVPLREIGIGHSRGIQKGMIYFSPLEGIGSDGLIGEMILELSTVEGELVFARH